jgi:hypothetical protein
MQGRKEDGVVRLTGRRDGVGDGIAAAYSRLNNYFHFLCAGEKGLRFTRAWSLLYAVVCRVKLNK